MICVYQNHIQLTIAQHKKKVGMTKKYHTQTLQTKQPHREEEPQNTKSHKTSGWQLK